MVCSKFMHSMYSACFRTICCSAGIYSWPLHPDKVYLVSFVISEGLYFSSYIKSNPYPTCQRGYCIIPQNSNPLHIPHSKKIVETLKHDCSIFQGLLNEQAGISLLKLMKFVKLVPIFPSRETQKKPNSHKLLHISPFIIYFTLPRIRWLFPDLTAYYVNFSLVQWTGCRILNM